ncbi:MAG: hypothetical protein Q7S69_07425 [Nitrosomonadaceae bacterium]|nr:hypothetical protein [Nitrosomonadaceae bacterium]
MNRIQLAKLRDIAIEYLPAAQQYREEVKARPTEDRESQGYAWALWRIADETIARHEATGEELAAACVLLGITSYELYDPSDIASASLYKARGIDTDPKKMRDAMRQGIMNAAKTLANVTGRDIPLVDPLVYFVDPVIPDDALAAVEQAATDGERIPVAKQQDKVILDWLALNKYDPLKIPVRPLGGAGIRKECGDALREKYKKLFQSKKVFDTAWQRLRDNSQMKDAE